MSESSPAAFRVVVHGHVQGVNFREYVLTRARFLGLAGYVRNLPDGRSVEVVAEGPRPDLEQILEHLHEGPRLSRVDAVDVEWEEPTGEHRHFGVAY